MDEPRVRATSAVDDIHTAVTHIDGVNAIIAAGAVAELLTSRADTSEVGTELTKDETRRNAAAVQIPQQSVFERIGGDLNNSVVRAIFEVALVLQGALQFDCDPEVIQRIEAAIELLDETVMQTRAIVFGLSSEG